MTDTAQVADATPIADSNSEPAQAPEPLNTEMASIKEAGQEQREAEQAAKEAAEKLSKKEDKEKPERSKNSREALKKASEKLKAEAKDKPEAEPKAEKHDAEAKKQPDQEENKAKEAEKSENQPEREQKQAENDAEKGQEQPKAENTGADTEAKQTRFATPPKRFSEDAKAAWETAPEPVKAEIHRAVEEMEGGLQKYQQAFEVIKPYAQLAQEKGTTIPQAMDNYINLEKTLLQDPERGLQMVADYAGIDLREFAGKLLSQTPEQIQGNQDNTIRELRAELADLKNQLGGVSTHLQQQHTQSIEQSVKQFADQNPRFEELSDDIKLLIQMGKAKTLEDAYAIAERLNPAPQQVSDPEPILDIQKPDPAQTRKASKSISGPPSNGSTPSAKREPSKSIRGALQRAAGRA